MDPPQRPPTPFPEQAHVGVDNEPRAPQLGNTDPTIGPEQVPSQPPQPPLPPQQEPYNDDSNMLPPLDIIVPTQGPNLMYLLRVDRKRAAGWLVIYGAADLMFLSLLRVATSDEKDVSKGHMLLVMSLTTMFTLFFSGMLFQASALCGGSDLAPFAAGAAVSTVLYGCGAPQVWAGEMGSGDLVFAIWVLFWITFAAERKLGVAAAVIGWMGGRSEGQFEVLQMPE